MIKQGMTTKQTNLKKRVLALITKWGTNENEASAMVEKHFAESISNYPTSKASRIAELILTIS